MGSAVEKIEDAGDHVEVTLENGRHVRAEMLLFAEGLARVFVAGLYYGLPHFELFDMRRRMVHGWGAAPWPVVAGVLLYACLWTAGLLCASAAIYRNKSLRRDLLG